MSGHLFAVERWAQRNPRVRFPLLLLALLLLVGLAGGVTGGGASGDAHLELPAEHASGGFDLVQPRLRQGNDA